MVGGSLDSARGGRANPYGLSPELQEEFRHAGALHTLVYPVEVTGLLLPERPLQQMFEKNTENPLRHVLNQIFKGLARLETYQDLFRWLGLHDYPAQASREIPFPEGQRPDYRMGYSRLEKKGVSAFTISCAGCHAGNLFGDRVLGMSNRFPRANHFFIRGQKASHLYRPGWFRIFTGATRAETELVNEALNSLNSVGLKMPLQLGLDTSLAQVALSLNKRSPTPWAEPSPIFQRTPRADPLDHQPGDSKPASWWNLKYKNRWLSDGSVVSGNPIHTNLLWNEIGRGTDLRKLSAWLDQNSRVIAELTTAVFATEAPRIEKYFPETWIVKERALRGEALYKDLCSRCHGTYLKAWSLPEASQLSWREQIQTIRVQYPHQTRVVDVGTDPNRYQTMKSLEKLNNLEISKRIGVRIRAQKGYVPPPLVGIWARWPYLHNNSIPSLCALLTPAEERPVFYYAGEALDRQRDFDFDCNGYPQGRRTPAVWKTSAARFDTRREGLRNTGHDQEIFMDGRQNLISAEDRRDLIQFLQTL
ncbi:MAG: hypothetical protein ACK5Y2_13470 [Bdellovibrionales bacterium]